MLKTLIVLKNGNLISVFLTRNCFGILYLHTRSVSTKLIVWCGFVFLGDPFVKFAHF